MSEREKTYVEDVNRSIYDIRNEEKDVYRIQKGLTPAIVEEISAKKKDPAWMANFRLQSLQIYNEMEVPDWGPSIEGLNMEDIVTYVKPNTHMSANGPRYRRISRILLRSWESHRRSESHSLG